MSNLICKDCKSTDVTVCTPGIFGDSRHRCNSCGKISFTADFVEPTLFDRITASPDVLARSLCGTIRIGCLSGYYSMLTGRYYPDMEKAVAATLEKLNKVSK